MPLPGVLRLSVPWACISYVDLVILDRVVGVCEVCAWSWGRGLILAEGIAVPVAVLGNCWQHTL